jgi:hypothetical protein
MHCESVGRSGYNPGMAKAPEQDSIAFLAFRKFPMRASWETRDGRKRIVNKQPETDEARKAYADELRAKSPEEIEELVQAAKQEMAAEKLKRQENERSYNRPHTRANSGTYDYWSKASFWSIDEATALLLERNPDSVDHDNVKAYLQVSAFAGRYCGLHELLRRAVSANQLTRFSSPSTVLAWAKRNRIDIPEGLQAAIDDLGIQVADWKTAYEKAKEIAEKCRADEAKTIEWAREQVSEAAELLERQNKQYGEALETARQEADLSRARGSRNRGTRQGYS